jgi:hypothetical protein
MKKPFDRPILRVRRAKSALATKVESIPNHVYKLLRFYCYAVEEFGMHLQQLARRGTLTVQQRSMRNTLGFNCSDFDYRPTAIYHREQPLQLTKVPNVYCWANRDFLDMDTGKSTSIYMPHCTALRLLIASLESGLRLSELQWLDRRNWDAWNLSTAVDGGFFPMHVRSDSARGAKTIYASSALRDLLRREEYFQDSFADIGSYAPAYHDGGRSTFYEVRPLFREARSGLPIGESAYRGAWDRLMTAFEWFYKEHTGEHLILPTLPPTACRAIYQANRLRALTHYLASTECTLAELAGHFSHSMTKMTVFYAKSTSETDGFAPSTDSSD